LHFSAISAISTIPLLLRLKFTCPAHILFRKRFVFFRLSALNAAAFFVFHIIWLLASLFRPKPHKLS